MEKMVKMYKGDLVEYSIFDLVDFYDPILRTPTTPLKLETMEELKYAHFLAFSMAETLSKLEGLGLSANQVGLSHRVCVINMGDEIWTMFNPEIIEKSYTISEYQEGCLSYPGLYLKLNRPDHIKVRFQATNGEWVEKEFDGLTAVCIQHEIDHLDGVVYTDKISPIKLNQAKRKVKQNLKRMKRYLQERNAAVQEAQILAEKQKARLQSSDAPTIKILSPTETVKKEPDKFVYGVG
jgi:peptide deformylase